jgi:hypothetical protein
MQGGHLQNGLKCSFSPMHKHCVDYHASCFLGCTHSGTSVTVLSVKYFQNKKPNEVRSGEENGHRYDITLSSNLFSRSARNVWWYAQLLNPVVNIHGFYLSVSHRKQYLYDLLELHQHKVQIQLSSSY